jgi:hypothetical protein
VQGRVEDVLKHWKRESPDLLLLVAAYREKRAAELRQTIIRATWERDGLEIALGRTERRLAEVERNKSKVLHYLERAWLRTRWYLIAGLAWFLLWLMGTISLQLSL